MEQISNLVRHIRPAVLGSAIGHLSGLSRRKNLRTSDGTFWISPVSNFGWQLAHGGYESGMRAVLSRYLRPGRTFIDFGANEGYFTVLASQVVGPRGSVIAVEPQSRLQTVLQTNLRLNKCYNVRLIGAAISSTTGPVSINLAPDISSGGSSLFKATKYECRKEEVDSFTLSELFCVAGIDGCDLMKVDIEGAEYDVFMGARDILQTGVIRNIALEISQFHPRKARPLRKCFAS